MKAKLSQITHNPYNTRKDYGDLSGLQSSIKKFGLTQPFLTRKTSKGYELAFGSRRYMALKQMGKKEVDIEVREIDQKDMALLALCENIHRKDLNAVELARAYNVGLKTSDMSLHFFARTIGVSDSTVKDYLSILKLPQQILNKADKYNNAQLICLGKLQNLSTGTRVMLENVLENKPLSAQFLRQITTSCECIYESNLPDKTKKELAGEVIFHDYSNLPPENYKDIRTFSDAIFGRAITKHQEGLRKTQKAREKLKPKRGKPRVRKVTKITDIVHIDKKLEDVTDIIRAGDASVQKAIKNDYYEKASKRTQKKFRTAVNHLVSGIEKILEND